MYVDTTFHFKSLEPLYNKIIKTKASLGPQWIIGIAVMIPVNVKFPLTRVILIKLK